MGQVVQDDQDAQDAHDYQFSPNGQSEDETMTKQYEYRVCAMQNGRITFVNGQWQGTIAPGTEDPNEALDTCPVIWVYMQEAGQSGWQLVSAINQPLQDVHLQTLFLMRESADGGEDVGAQDGESEADVSLAE